MDAKKKRTKNEMRKNKSTKHDQRENKRRKHIKLKKIGRRIENVWKWRTEKQLRAEQPKREINKTKRRSE